MNPKNYQLHPIHDNSQETRNTTPTAPRLHKI